MPIATATLVKENAALNRIIGEMQAVNDEMRIKHETMEAKHEELRIKHNQMEAKHAEEIALIREKYEQLRREYFSSRSEKMRALLTQDDLLQGRLFDEIETNAVSEETVVEAEDVTVAAHKRKKTGRKPLRDDLPRVEVIHDISEEDKICTCGAELVRIGEETSEKLDIIPMTIRVLRTVRPKYACKSCEGLSDETEPAVTIAPVPPEIIPKGLATAGTLAHILTGKFCDALPFYRQEKMLARFGIDIPRATMCNNVIFVHQKYRDFFDLFWNEIYSYPMVGLDETTVQVLKEPGRKDTQKSYMWVFRGGGDRPLVQFRYGATRSKREIIDFTEKYQGCVQTDGYGEYDKLDLIKGIRHAGCWAHARRKFVDAYESSASIMKKTKAKQLDFGGAFAQKILGLIGKLYGVEKQARKQKELLNASGGKEFTLDDLKTLRQELSKPTIEQIKNSLDEQVHHIAPQSLCGKAISYALNQWSRLTVYLDDGLFGIDNNPVENAIRPFVIGRKNWLFSGSPTGAAASASIYSLIETAKANDLEPYWYLRYLFEHLPSADASNRASLLPNRLDPTVLSVWRQGVVR